MMQWFRTLRRTAKARRARRQSSPIRYVKPCLEGCEERVVPANTLHWVDPGPVAGNFSTPGNWQENVAPAAGDTLVFTGPAAATAIDDMAGLSLAGLDINNTGQTVQLNNPLTVTDSFTLNNGTLTGPSNLTMNNAAGTATLSGGTLDTTFIAGGTGVQPTVGITAGSSQTSPFTITSNGKLDNFGNATLSGDGDHITNNGTITNESGATFDIQSDVNIDRQFGGSVGNSGTFQKSGGAGSYIDGLAFTNSGDLLLKSGTLTIYPRILQTRGSMQLVGGNLASPDFDILLQGGTLTGNGQITCTNLDNQKATVSPGFNGSPASINIIGNYTQESGGTLVIAINPIGGYSILNVVTNPNVAGTGKASLAGTLNVNKDPNYTPPYGQTLGIVTAQVGVSGDFGSVNITNNQWYNGADNLTFIWQLNSNGKEFDLVATYYG